MGLGAFALVFIFCIAGLGISVPVLYILNAWLVNRTMSGGIALTSIVMLLILFFSVWQMRNIAAVFVFIVILIGVCAISPMLEDRADRRAMRRMHDEDIAKCLRVIKFDEKNAAAHSTLADLYVEDERYAEAVAEYERAIELAPETSGRERYRLKKARESLEGNARRPIRVCEHCKCESPVGTVICPNCREPMQVGVLAWFFRRENLTDFARTATLVMIVCTTLAVAFSKLPLDVKGCVIIASLIVGAFLFLRRVGGNT